MVSTNSPIKMKVEDFKEEYKYEPQPATTVDRLIEVIQGYDSFFDSISDYELVYNSIIEVGQTLIDNEDPRMTILVDFMYKNKGMRFISIKEAFGVDLDFEKYIDGLFILGTGTEAVDA